MGILSLARALLLASATYVGGAQTPGNYAAVEVMVTDSGAFLTMPMEGIMRRRGTTEKSGIGLNGTYRFAVGPLVIHAEVAGTRLGGQYVLADKSYDLVGRRIATLTPAQLAGLLGSYKTQKGEWIHVTARSNPAFSGLTFVNETTGRLGAIFPESDSVFSGGPGRLVPVPAEVRLVFRHNGAGAQLVYSEDSSAPVVATRTSTWSEQHVAIPAHGANLAGSLYVPKVSQKSPAIVLVHGSDPNTRFTGALPAFLARMGFMVLTYDKRGNGESTGDFAHANLDTLAADVSAAVDLLAADPRVDASRIGLWGISQGGWVAPLAVSHGARVSFVLLHSGATLSPREQGRDELSANLRSRGLPAEEIRMAEEYQQLYFDAMINPSRRPAFDSAYEAQRSRGATWMWSSKALDNPAGKWFAGIAGYDPEPALHKLVVPTLAMFGESDILVPPTRHVPPLLRAAQEAGNADVTVVVFPRASHRMEVAVPGYTNDLAVASRYAPGYYKTMEDWLDHYVLHRQ